MSEEDAIGCICNANSLSSDQRTETEINKHVITAENCQTSDSIVFLYNLTLLLVKVPKWRLPCEFHDNHKTHLITLMVWASDVVETTETSK